MERRFWKNWMLLVGVTIITTVGLVIVNRTLLSERFVNPWPWVKTEYTLLVVLIILVSAFTAYLTHKQRQITIWRRRFQRLQEQTHERTRRNYARLLALFNVSHLMGMDNHPQTVFDCITNMCVEAFDCEQASLMLASEDGTELEVQSATGHVNLAEVLGNRQRIGEGIAGWVAKHREPLLVEPHMDARKYPGLVLRDRALSTAMVVPIIIRNELVGILNVSSRDPGFHYDREDLHTLQVFAGNAGACIRYAEERDSMIRTNRELREGRSESLERIYSD
jgi:hypothetical protein